MAGPIDEPGVAPAPPGAWLDVRRTSVLGSANKLQEEGLITYKRGVIRIVDRKGLEKRSCECYGAVRAAVAESMPR
ncbi:MAG: winged helix-turn-helix domain-containing protein [Betaproteobacteria bacterium]|nr:winged helix-turn-helix domain-containing protein [Betaproteobacteria bacterium]